MKRLTIAIVATLTAIAPPVQAEGLKQQLVGTWELVSLTVNQADRTVDLFGTAPRGIQVMTADGHFVNVITRESLPLYAGANRMQGSPEEYTAIGQGSNALFGTWEVDEEAGIVTFNVDVSTFPNWEGEKQRRKFTVEGDTWRYINPMTTVGPGNVEVVWTRKPSAAELAAARMATAVEFDVNYGWGTAGIPE